jgi:hypothetical protein
VKTLKFWLPVSLLLLNLACGIQFSPGEIQLFAGNGPVFSPTPTATETVTLPSTATPTAVPQYTVVPASTPPAYFWDTRLSELGVVLIQVTPVAGQPLFRLVEARYIPEAEAGGLNHIYVNVLN